MVVITRAKTMTGLCPFSKKYFKYPNIICLFDNSQFNKFKDLIHELLNRYLNNDLIEIIIKYTNYSKYINRFGHLIYACWEKNDNKIKNKIRILNYSNRRNMSDSDEESERNSDSENESVFIY